MGKKNPCHSAFCFHVSCELQMRLVLTTCVTAVWFFSSVPSLVFQKLSVRVEGLSTLVAGEGLFCCMSPFVLLQITQIVKSWTKQNKKTSVLHTGCHFLSNKQNNDYNKTFRHERRTSTTDVA